jgi:dihydrofolate reductase
MILAIDHGGAIGWSDGRLPWKLSADMKRFKELTTGGTVVMGRTTYLSLGLPNGLPNRRNIVLSRRPYSEIRGQIASDVVIISSLDWVKRQSEIAAARAAEEWQDEIKPIWIIGGKSVYEEALKKDMVSEIHMTLVHTVSNADIQMDTDLVAWKRFILTERKRGVNWEAEFISHQWDGDFQTTYITLTRK